MLLSHLDWPLNGLTLKQELFSLYFVMTGNGAKSFRQAYGQKLRNPNNYSVEAWRLKRKPNVGQRIVALHKQSQVELKEHLDRLEALSKAAEGDGDYRAAIKAEELRGKASGHYVERHEHNHTANADPSKMSLDDIDKELKAIDVTPDHVTIEEDQYE